MPMLLGPGPSSEIANDLMRLAGEKSSEKRVELLRRVTDTYLGHVDASSTAEKYLFDELVATLVGKIDRNERVRASTYFSKLEKIPDSLAHRFATDADIRVAEAMVRDYRGLAEHTLIEVAQNGSQGHLYAIASRSTVPERVTDIVVDRGDRRAVRTLAGNKGAQFSRLGMNKLIGKAEKDAELQSLIVDRADLSAEAIGKLLPMVSDELAAHLQNKGVQLDDAAIEGHLAEWLDDRKKSIERTAAYVEGVRTGNLQLNDVAIELVRNRRVFDFVAVVSAILDMNRDVAFSHLTKGPIQAVLLLLRSVGLSWRAVEAFVRLRNVKFFAGHAPSRVEREDYESIDVAGAQRAVRFMKVRKVVTATGADVRTSQPARRRSPASP